MSRYRATTGELLEQVRMFEGKMKDIYNMAFAGDKADTIAKKLKLDVDTVKKVLGEEIAIEKVERVPTGQYIVTYKDPNGKGMARVFDYRQHAHDFEKEMKKKGMTEDWKDTNKRNVEKHGSTGKTQGEDKVKSLENEIQRLKLELENEKNATVKPEPNPDTGEVPLTVGVAHKYLKDKQKKEVKKEEVELNEKEEFHLFDNKKDAEKKAKEIGGKVIDGTAYRAGHYAVYKGKKEEVQEATFSRAMISQLKKAYGNLKTITPDNAKKLGKIIDTVTKDGLIDLYKSKIPFVSTAAGTRLSMKHNLSPADILSLIHI